MIRFNLKYIVATVLWFLVLDAHAADLMSISDQLEKILSNHKISIINSWDGSYTVNGIEQEASEHATFKTTQKMYGSMPYYSLGVSSAPQGEACWHSIIVEIRKNSRVGNVTVNFVTPNRELKPRSLGTNPNYITPQQAQHCLDTQRSSMLKLIMTRIAEF